MAVLKILTYPDTRLSKPSEAVESFDDSLRMLVRDMLDTMYQAPGIGLAAVQINVHKKIFVIDIDYKREEKAPYKISETNPRVFINPKIKLKNEGTVLFKEACLSVPGVYTEVKRSKSIHVEYLDMDGKLHMEDLDDLLAIVVQHENDHLLGKLFIDRLSFVKSKILKQKLKKSTAL